MNGPDAGPAGSGPASAGLTGAGLVVRHVTVRAVVVPFRRPLATKVGHFAQWPLLLIDVTTEQGITGRSFLAPYLASAAAGLRTVLHELGEGLRGQPAAPGQVFTGARGWFALAGYQGLAVAAVAVLDIALWDALAQAAQLPLARLLGGTLEPVPPTTATAWASSRPPRSPTRRSSYSPRAASPR
jgi:mandelate racemase